MGAKDIKLLQNDSRIQNIDFQGMQPNFKTRQKWINNYNNATKIPSLNTKRAVFGDLPTGSNQSLLDHLEYSPSERDQGFCGNCWAWAGTGVLETALHVNENIKKRLSLQYINSCGDSVSGILCCDGGWLYHFADFYENTSKTIPWSNTNASWQDADASCDTACSSISTYPNYPISSIEDISIQTHTMANETAINNIKTILNEQKAVWFAFFLPTAPAWADFVHFWNNDGEDDVYQIDKFCNIPYTTGVGHAVLCIGYNEDDENNSYWMMVNSWGNSSNRPQGLFRINMDMDYSGTCPGIGNGNYCFYWQTLNVTFNISLPEVITNSSIYIEETHATLRGTLLNNGSKDTTGYFLVDISDLFHTPIDNISVGNIEENEIFTYALSNLSPGQKYYVKATANNSNGWNTWSNPNIFLTKPFPPSLFSSQSINATTIFLNWTNAIGANTTYIESNTIPQWSRGNGTMIYNDSGSQYEHHYLSEGTTRYYQAWSYTTWGAFVQWSDTSVSTNNTTNYIPRISNEHPFNQSININPTTPLNITISDKNNDPMTLLWKSNSSGTWNPFGSNTTIQNGTYQQINNNFSQYNTTYYWNVTVTDGKNTNISTVYQFTTRDSYTPSAPENTTTMVPSATEINLTWTKASYADTTHIQRNKGGYPTNITNGTTVYNGTGSTYRDTYLTEGTRYYYRIWSYNATDNVYSNTNVSITTKTNTIPRIHNEMPMNQSTHLNPLPSLSIMIDDLDDDPMTLSWWSNSSGSWKVFGTNTSSRNGTYTQRNNNYSHYNETFYWNVTVRDGKDHNMSNIFHFTTRNSYNPSPPQNFKACIPNENQINITWNKDAQTDSVRIQRKQSQPPANRNDGLAVYNGTGLYYVNNSFNHSALYFFRAWSYNDTDGLWSLMNVSCSNAPNMPSNFTAQSNNPHQIDLTWTKPYNADKTLICYKKGSTAPRNQTDGITKNATGNTTSITGLTAQTRYSITIWSWNDTSGSWSVENASTSVKTKKSEGSSGTSFAPSAPKENPPVISDIAHNPLSPKEHDEIMIATTVTDDNQIDSVILHWNDGMNHSEPMPRSNDTSYSLSIGSFDEFTNISYWITASDSSSQQTTTKTYFISILDSSAPKITHIFPMDHAVLFANTSMIQIKYTDHSNLNPSHITLKINNHTIPGDALNKTHHTITYIPPSPFNIGEHTVFISLTDVSGNMVQKQWVFTIEKAETVSHFSLGTISKGETKEISIEQTNTSIHQIILACLDDSTNMSMTLATFQEPPEDLTPIKRTIYQYHHIQVFTNSSLLSDKIVESMQIIFSISKTWITQNNIDPTNITIWYKNNGSWTELNTIKTHDDEDHLYYSIIAPHISGFAITGREKNKDPAERSVLIYIVLTIILCCIGLFIVYTLWKPER